MKNLLQKLSLIGRKIQNKTANFLFGFSNEQLDYVYDAQYIDGIKSDLEELSSRMENFDPSDYDFDPLNDYDFSEFIDYSLCQDIAQEVATEAINDREAENADIVEEKLKLLEEKIAVLEQSLKKKKKKSKKKK
jgi:hypothetical protein